MPKLLINSRNALNRLRETLFKRLFRARFRYDIFLSYSHRDSKDYAANLKKQLEKLDFSCFIDKEESPPGSPLDPTLAKALKKSAVFVLLATERALGRPYVISEFEKFASTNRTIVPININETLSKNDEAALTKSPWNIVKERDIVWIDEADEAFTKKNPSPAVADGIDKLFKYTRRNVRVRAEIIGTAALVLLAALGAGLIIMSQAAAAELARKNAADQTQIANDAIGKANAASEEAKRQQDIANTAINDAKHQQELARTATAEAKKQQELARLAKLEADKQQRLADANELANRAVVSRTEEPRALEQSVRDATKAVSEFAALKTTSTSADYALRSTSSLLHPTAATIAPDGIYSADGVALSPDGKYLALGGSYLKICTVASAPKCASKPIHSVSKLAFSPNQQYLTTISSLGGDTVTVWKDWHTENPIPIKTIDYSPQPFAFSADGSHLAFASGVDKKQVSVDVINTSSATRSNYRLPLSEGRELTGVSKVAVSGNGQFLALSLIVNEGDMIVQVWDLSSNQIVAEVPAVSRRLNDEQKRNKFVLGIALSNDGSNLALNMSEIGVTEDAVFVWDVKYFQLISQLQLRSDDSDTMRFSPDGTFLATSSTSGVARIWEVDRGTEIARFIPPPRGSRPTGIGDIAFSANGKFFGLIPEFFGPVLAQVWDISAISLDAPIRWRSLQVKAILSDKAKYLAAAGMNYMKIWDVAERQLLPTTFDPELPPEQVVFSPNERFVAIKDSGGDWWMSTVANPSEELGLGSGGELSFSLNSEYLVRYGVYRNLTIFKLDSKKALAIIPKEAEIDNAALSPNAKYVAVAPLRGSVARILTVTESNDLMKDQPHAPAVSLKTQLTKMVWSPNERYVAVADVKGNVAVFDVLKNSVVVTSELAPPYSELQFSANSRYFLVPGHSRSVIGFDLSNGYKGFELPLTNTPEVLATTPDSRHLAVSLGNLTVEVWDLDTRQRMSHMRLENRVTSMAFTQDDKYLVVMINRDMVAHKLLWRPRDLIAEAQRRLR